MKNSILVSVRYILLCILFVSCSNDDDSNGPDVELGENYLIAKIDGEDFVATGDMVSFQSSMVSNVMFVYIVATVDGKVLNMTMSGYSFPPQMPTYNSGPYGSSNSYTIEQDEWIGTSQIETEVVLDTSMKGIFSFTIINTVDSSVKTVTDGEFLWTY